MPSSPPDDPVELGAWVLDDGLPPLPSELGVDDIVPIARWRGEEVGAVLFASRYFDDDDGEYRGDAEIQTYRRVDGEWLPSSGSGGGGWFEAPLQRPELPDSYAAVSHLHATQERTGPVCAAYGFAGRAAAFVEVVTPAGSTVAPLDSPVGAFVVASDGTSDAIVRVLSAEQRVLAEQRFAPDPSLDMPR